MVHLPVELVLNIAVLLSRLSSLELPIQVKMQSDLRAFVQMSDSARQMLAVCERNPSDAVQLKYDPRNPFDLCSITFTPIYRYWLQSTLTTLMLRFNMSLATKAQAVAMSPWKTGRGQGPTKWFLCCRGNKFVECPYTGARFQPQCSGELSPVGNVAKIGADVSGLVCSPIQVR